MGMGPISGRPEPAAGREPGDDGPRGPLPLGGGQTDAPLDADQQRPAQPSPFADLHASTIDDQAEPGPRWLGWWRLWRRRRLGGR